MQTQKEFMLITVAAAFLLFILLSFILTMLFFHKRKQGDFQREVEVIKTNFEKELLETQLEIQEQTFQHISRELHDNVGHFLSLAKLQLATIQTELALPDVEKLSSSVCLITNSLDEIRNIAKSLNTENIKSNGLIKTTEQQVEQVKKLGRFSVDFAVSGKTCFLDDQKEIVLFRILQEGLNNILKHSQASAIHINLHYEERQLILSIRDNGIGFNANNMSNNDHYGSSGIKNIIKRSSLINAFHEIISTPGEGTTIKVITPY